MATIIIEDNNPQTEKLLEYLKTLPFVTIIEDKKKNFCEAAEECNAVSVDEFFDELNDRIKKHFRHEESTNLRVG